MSWIILIISICFALAIFLTIQYSLFIPPKKGIAVLMYHQVKPGVNSRICIAQENLEKQFQYLIIKGYTCLNMADLLKQETKVPKKSFVLTFDDAYENNLTYLYPLLVKYNLHATIMIPVKYLGSVNEWDGSGENIMTVEQLKSMDSKYISFGHHTFSHKNLRIASLQETQEEIVKSMEFYKSNNLTVLPVLAYPYGGYPKEKAQMQAFFNTLKNNGIGLGFRIGNKKVSWPLKNNYLVKRIDIRGIDSMWEFKTKIKKGRVKMF